MKDKSFLDTNVLIYCYAVSEPEKQMKAQTVANLSDTVISTQVLKELSSILRRKYGLDWSNIRAAIEEAQTNFEVYVNTIDSIKAACDIAKQYQLSFMIA
jgi:predicted nucleic acid-binding protein